jgi:hypothetical protein
MPHHPGPLYEVDTPVRQHRDLRAAARSRKRGRDQYHKYIKYTEVNRGQQTAAHFTCDAEHIFGTWPIWPALIEECDSVDRLSKRQFYSMALVGQRCRHHGPCPLKRMKDQKKWVEYKRGSNYAKEQARKWTQCTDDVLPPNWRWYPDPDSVAKGCDGDLICVEGWCTCPEENGLTMADIVASRGTCIVFNDKTAMGDDTDSVVSANTEDWSEVGSIASWDDFMDVKTVDGCFCEDESEWSEVEVE